MDDEPQVEQLENRIDTLESTIKKMIPSRRDALKMGGAALAGGSLMAGTASAGTNQVGTIGSASQPVDIESEDINNADTMTTQDLVVNGTATGPFGEDMQGCRVFLSSDQTISGGTREKIQFDSEVYDLGGNFDTTSSTYTCPKDGLYFANLQARFDSGGSNDRRLVRIGNNISSIRSNEGAENDVIGSTQRTMSVSTMNRYNASDNITPYAFNADSNDNLTSGDAGFGTFFEVVFLGSL
jgi:hypothetical protein